MKNYMLAQKKKIEIDKWCEGCRIENDPGQGFVLNWIKKNAPWFREEWDQAVCKKCASVDECGYEVRPDCENFKNNSSVLKDDG